MKFIYSLMLSIFIVSCTENQAAKQFGGTMKVDLPPNTKFVNATWKNEELWYIYRPRKVGESVDIVTMQENSNWGIMEGKVEFNEH
jgi:hypothetical protein